MAEQVVGLRLNLNADDLKKELAASGKAGDQLAGDMQGMGGKIDAVMRGVVDSAGNAEQGIRGVDQRLELLTGADREVFLRANVGQAEAALRQIDQMLTDPTLTDTEIRIVMDKRNEAATAIESLKGELAELGPAAAEAGQDMERGLNVGALGAALAGAGLSSRLGEAVTSAGRLRAQLGLTADEAREFDRIAKQVYADNFGDTMSEAAQVVGLVNQALGLVGEDLRLATIDVFRVADAFEHLGAEPQILIEDLRAMKDLWPGADEEQLLDMVAASFQRGTGSAGDLQDTLQEYPGYFSNIGLTAEDMFRILDLGMENNARNTDLVADSFKEMTLLMREEGSTAQDAIRDLFPEAEADRLISDFAAGGEAGRDAFYSIIEAVGSAGDEQDRFNAIMAVFGDIGGDNANVIDDMIPKLLAMKDETGGVADATSTLDEQYAGLQSTLETLTRRLETSTIGTIADVGGGLAEIGVAAGTALLGFNGIRDSLPSLDGRLGRVGATAARAGAQIGILYAAGQILDATINDLNRADLNGLQRALLDLGDGAEVAGEAADAFGDDFGKLGSAIERVTAPSVISQADHAVNTISTFGGLLGRGKGDLEQARQTIDDLDKALAILATTDAPAAASALAALKSEIGDEAYGRLLPLLNDYESALDGLDVQSRTTTAGGMNLFESAIAGLGDVINTDGIPPVDDLAEAIEAYDAALRSHLDPIWATQDALLSHKDAQDAVKQAQSEAIWMQGELTEAVRKYGRDSPEAAEAARKLMDAQIGVNDANRDVTRSAMDVDAATYRLAEQMRTGNVSIEAAEEQLRGWVEQGLITAEQAWQTAEELRGTAGAADALGNTDPTVYVSMNAEQFWAERARVAQAAFDLTGSVSIGGGAVVKHDGGTIHGAPGQEVDVRALAGEYVIRAPAAQALGYDQLERLNRADQAPAMLSGSAVAAPMMSGASGPQISASYQIVAASAREGLDEARAHHRRIALAHL